ncbi:MAG TPA: single-stranded DNA-binding protein [Actinomycetota bacterium]|nr:single-stranded DNA-binding protein [Actinomycetota bacterium]
MASENTVTLVGNITDDPELRFTPSGLPVANFTVAVNRRVPKDGGWEDKLEGFFRCSCWRDMAENVAESLTKGARVMVVGRLQQRSWEDQDGNKRSAVEVQVDEVGPSLRWATARPERSQRSSGGFGGGGSRPSSQPPASASSPAPGDAWGAPASVGGPVPDEGGF